MGIEDKLKENLEILNFYSKRVEKGKIKETLDSTYEKYFHLPREDKYNNYFLNRCTYHNPKGVAPNKKIMSLALMDTISKIESDFNEYFLNKKRN